MLPNGGVELTFFVSGSDGGCLFGGEKGWKGGEMAGVGVGTGDAS